jgi:hypothetical protein
MGTASSAGAFLKALGLGVRVDSLPNFQAMDRNVGRDLESQADLIALDRENCDFEQSLEAVSSSDHNRFMTFSRQDQHDRTSVFMV